jgi:hypothetical protein
MLERRERLARDLQVMGHQELVRLAADAVATAETSTGVCEVARPAEILRPVLRDDGLHWCCEHRPQHCTKAVAGLA